MRNFLIPRSPATLLDGQSNLVFIRRLLGQSLAFPTIVVVGIDDNLAQNEFGARWSTNIASQQVSGEIIGANFMSEASSGTIFREALDVLIFNGLPTPAPTVGSGTLSTTLLRSKIGQFSIGTSDWEPATPNAGYGHKVLANSFVTDSTGDLHGMVRHLGAVTLNDAGIDNEKIILGLEIRYDD